MDEVHNNSEKEISVAEGCEDNESDDFENDESEDEEIKHDIDDNEYTFADVRAIIRYLRHQKNNN